MTLTRRQTLIGAAATVAAAALPVAAEAEPEFIEIIVYDSIEDDLADAWALSTVARVHLSASDVSTQPNTCANSKSA
jgi:hypothetical protein